MTAICKAYEKPTIARRELLPLVAATLTES